jgi:hypothetical protein
MLQSSAQASTIDADERQVHTFEYPMTVGTPLRRTLHSYASTTAVMGRVCESGSCLRTLRGCCAKPRPSLACR